MSKSKPEKGKSLLEKIGIIIGIIGGTITIIVAYNNYKSNHAKELKENLLAVVNKYYYQAESLNYDPLKQILADSVDFYNLNRRSSRQLIEYLKFKNKQKTKQWKFKLIPDNFFFEKDENTNGYNLNFDLTVDKDTITNIVAISMKINDKFKISRINGITKDELNKNRKAWGQ